MFHRRVKGKQSDDVCIDLCLYVPISEQVDPKHARKMPSHLYVFLKIDIFFTY